MGIKMGLTRIHLFLAIFALLQLVDADCVPSRGCTALAYYNLSQDQQLNNIYSAFNTTSSSLQQYNNIPNENFIQAGQVIRIPFSCSCINGRLSHIFKFDGVNATDTRETINKNTYHRLSDGDEIYSTTPDNHQVYPNSPAYVPVNCSCGDPDIPQYGLFITYPVQPNDTKDTIAASFNTTVANLTRYNPLVNINSLSSEEDHLFIPAQVNGTYPRFVGDPKSNNTPTIVGATVGGVAAVMVCVAVLAYLLRRRKQKVRFRESHLESGLTKQTELLQGSNGAMAGNAPASFHDLAVDKSVEFSYEELAAATDNFNLTNKIGEGGYGAVYYGEIRGQKLAIKKMNMQATREFMSELKVLTHVHHTNLVQLIGYCTVDSLFLVYEYIDNGTLSHHLRGSGTKLSWNQRTQIALDAARGLEYIHEHTKPTYIHRDVKSPNILIDKNFRAKVADFGLTKLTESTAGGSASLTQPTRLVGTFGYMPPEYARFGDVSPKIDVYSFGVVLYEMISAKDAIVRTVDAEDSGADRGQKVLAKGLVTLFDAALKGPNPTEKLKELVDPALGTNYPFDSVWKLAKLAEACTQEFPENRPNMRAVVVALMTLCNTTQELDFSSGYSDANIHSLVTGR